MKSILITVINEFTLKAEVDDITYTVDRVFDIKTVNRFNYVFSSDTTLFGSKLLHKLFGVKRPLENYMTEEILLNFKDENKYPFEDIPVNMLKMLYIELGVLKTGDCLLSIANPSEFKYALVFRGPKTWHERMTKEIREGK